MKGIMSAIRISQIEPFHKFNMFQVALLLTVINKVWNLWTSPNCNQIFIAINASDPNSLTTALFSYFPYVFI